MKEIIVLMSLFLLGCVEIIRPEPIEVTGEWYYSDNMQSKTLQLVEKDGKVTGILHYRYYFYDIYVPLEIEGSYNSMFSILKLESPSFHETVKVYKGIVFQETFLAENLHINKPNTPEVIEFIKK